MLWKTVEVLISAKLNEKLIKAGIEVQNGKIKRSDADRLIKAAKPKPFKPLVVDFSGLKKNGSGDIWGDYKVGGKDRSIEKNRDREESAWDSIYEDIQAAFKAGGVKLELDQVVDQLDDMVIAPKKKFTLGYDGKKITVSPA